MYLHEVRSRAGVPAITHMRETARPSGLVGFNEIGFTYAVRPQTDESETFHAASKAGLVIARGVLRHPGVFDQEEGPREQISSESLGEFVDTAVERWERLLEGLGEGTLVRAQLNEVRSVDEEVTDSGLVVVSGPTTTSFERYVGTPDELVAIEQIAARATPPPAPGGPGANQYL